jgi:hypothetical protein
MTTAFVGARVFHAAAPNAKAPGMTAARILGAAAVRLFDAAPSRIDQEQLLTGHKNNSFRVCLCPHFGEGLFCRPLGVAKRGFNFAVDNNSSVFTLSTGGL